MTVQSHMWLMTDIESAAFIAIFAKNFTGSSGASFSANCVLHGLDYRAEYRLFSDTSSTKLGLRQAVP